MHGRHRVCGCSRDLGWQGWVPNARQVEKLTNIRPTTQCAAHSLFIALDCMGTSELVGLTVHCFTLGVHYALWFAYVRVTCADKATLPGHKK